MADSYVSSGMHRSHVTGKTKLHAHTHTQTPMSTHTHTQLSATDSCMKSVTMPTKPTRYCERVEWNGWFPCPVMQVTSLLPSLYSSWGWSGGDSPHMQPTGCPGLEHSRQRGMTPEQCSVWKLCVCVCVCMWKRREEEGLARMWQGQRIRSKTFWHHIITAWCSNFSQYSSWPQWTTKPSSSRVGLRRMTFDLTWVFRAKYCNWAVPKASIHQAFEVPGETQCVL